jgi:transcriptional regulator with XRE-family HTH domain
MNKLEKYLKHRSISQIGFAKKIGTTPNNLSSLIRGKSTPGLRLAYEIEKKTGGLVTLYDWIPEYSKKDVTETDDE